MNKRGAALIFTYLVIAVFLILTSVFLARSISESNIVRRYSDSERAFWIAEAGMHQAYFNWSTGVALPAGQVAFGGGTYEIQLAALPALPQAQVTGRFGTEQRIIRALFIHVPPPFENTFSAGRNFIYTGFVSSFNAWGITEVSGTYQGVGGGDWFEHPPTQGAPQNQTTISIPDLNGNGTPDEFGDFVEFGLKAVGDFAPEQVLYIESNGTVPIWPDRELAGIRVIFVRGPNPGQGNVNVFFDPAAWEGEDLTIISTGTIRYIQPLQFQENSRVSFVAWNNYWQGAIIGSANESVIFSHGDVGLTQIVGVSQFTGNIISNNDIRLNELFARWDFHYSPRAADGDFPPGFRWLTNLNGNLLCMDWQE